MFETYSLIEDDLLLGWNVVNCRCYQTRLLKEVARSRTTSIHRKAWLWLEGEQQGRCFCLILDGVCEAGIDNDFCGCDIGHKPVVLHCLTR